MWHVWRERRGAYRILVMTSDVQRPLRRSRDRWEDNIKTGLQEVGWPVPVAALSKA